MRAKQKTASQEEKIQKWKEHLKNLLGNSLKVTVKPITKIINCQLGQFREKEQKLKAEKLPGSMKYVWNSRKFDDILLRLSNTTYKQNRMEK